MKRRADALINRRNWRDTREYLRYYEEVLQSKPCSVAFARVALDHLLRWATGTPFPSATKLRPTYPAHIGALERSVEYERKLLNVARVFFGYARDRWPDRYDVIRRDFVDSLRSKRKIGQVRSRDLYTLADVRQLLTYQPQSRIDRRDRAAVAFLFLSGMRVGAFATMPVQAVHIERRPVMVNQWTSLGMHTKNGEVANTFLLDDPELDDLHAVVRSWDTEVRSELGDTGMWYALMEPDGETLSERQLPGEYRANGVRRRLRRLCDLAGATYYSPHKLRHGHIVWAAARCTSIADFKAVSQNVMHKQLATTDAIYSRLQESDVAQRIQRLGQRTDLSEVELEGLAQALFGHLQRDK